MSFTPTPHNAATFADIAKTVLMPGDPLRAKFIAETYLENIICFNTVRNMLGYTGTYKGYRISVMGSGMGMPSMGIYSYELFNFYGVEQIIRIGSVGAMNADIKLGELMIAQGASTDSDYASQYDLPGVFAPIADFSLLRRSVEIAEKLHLNSIVGNVLSSDVFYNDNKNRNSSWMKMNVLGVEMESAALYMNAARAGKKALTILTVSDNIVTGEAMSAEERQNGFTNMMMVALETAVSM